jgi:hypothetical protein
MRTNTPPAWSDGRVTQTHRVEKFGVNHWLLLLLLLLETSAGIALKVMSSRWLSVG